MRARGKEEEWKCWSALGYPPEPHRARPGWKRHLFRVFSLINEVVEILAIMHSTLWARKREE